MPVLNVQQPKEHIKRFYLPSTAALPKEDQAWVDVDVSPESVADWQAISDDDNNFFMRMSRIIVRRIRDWNFIDPNGTPIPISYNAFWSLQESDRVYLLSLSFDRSNVPPLNTEEKKT